MTLLRCMLSRADWGKMSMYILWSSFLKFWIMAILLWSFYFGCHFKGKDYVHIIFLIYLWICYIKKIRKWWAFSLQTRMSLPCLLVKPFILPRKWAFPHNARYYCDSFPFVRKNNRILSCSYSVGRKFIVLCLLEPVTKRTWGGV